MDLPRSLRWIEVDYPHVIALKETRLADDEPHCRLERLALDLTDRPARKAFLARVNAEAGKVLVLTEGVTPYLTEADVGALADDLHQTEKVRYWFTDYFSPEALKFGKKIRANSCAMRHSNSRPKIGSPSSPRMGGRRARYATFPRRPSGSAGRFPCRCG
jgi:O-methyltransferase involved in polyketide biosynthesis